LQKSGQHSLREVPLESEEDIDRLLSEVLDAPKELQLDDSDFHLVADELATIKSFVDCSQKYVKHSLEGD
jgi:hypothetical protein